MTVNPETAAAETTLRHLADEIARFYGNRRGSERAKAAIWVRSGTGFVTVAIEDGRGTGGDKYVSGDTVEKAVQAAYACINALPDAHAADPWFDPSHPINQPASAPAA